MFDYHILIWYEKVRKNVVLLLMNMLGCISIHDQHVTEFEFVCASFDKVRKTMQRNAKAVFKQIHEAYFANGQGIKRLSRINTTDTAIERIQAIWSVITR